MDRLEQIKNEVASLNGHKSWDSLLMSVENWTGYEGTSPDRFDDMWEEVARRYATEVARHNLERAAEAAEVVHYQHDHGSAVDKESILKLEIELI